MFLTCCSPRSSKAMSRRSRTCSCAAALTQIPPGSASASSLAAMLTPSPKMSPSSMMMSPTLMPIRKFDAALCRCRGVAGDHLPLQLDRTAHRIDDAGELDKQAVAGRLDDATPMLGDLGVAEFAPNRTQCRERALFVLAHQPRIARHVGRQDRRQPALYPLPA